MARTISVKRDEKTDYLCAEILEKGPNGVIQIRAVVPMKKIRALVDSALASKTGQPKSAISGSPDIQRRCAPVVQRLAGVHLFRAIAKAAQSPMVEQAQKRRQQLAMVARLVEIAESDDFEDQYGGWEGIQSAMARKRKTRYQAMIARGVPETTARSLTARSKIEDDIIVAAAMRETNEDEDVEEIEEETQAEVEDTSDPELFMSGDRDGRDSKVGGGFSFRNPFKRKKGRPSAAQRIEAARARQARAQEEQEAQQAEAEAKASETSNNPETPKDDASSEPIDAANPPRN